MNDMYVQYGCGQSAPAGWINFDSSPTLRFEKLPMLGKLYTRNASRFPKNILYGNIVRGLPVKENTCRGVYCSHVLEHLSLEDFRKTLQHTYTMLQEDGIFRLVLPDLEFYIKQYCENTSPDSAITFMKSTLLGKEQRATSLKGLLASVLGGSEHLWMWDYAGLSKELEHVGFRNIRRAQYADSSDPMFNEVEDVERWENCLGIECIK
jgi:hypothetical protein